MTRIGILLSGRSSNFLAIAIRLEVPKGVEIASSCGTKKNDKADSSYWVRVGTRLEAGQCAGWAFSLREIETGVETGLTATL